MSEWRRGTRRIVKRRRADVEGHEGFVKQLSKTTPIICQAVEEELDEDDRDGSPAASDHDE